MSRKVRTFDTFDIVLSPMHKDNVVRPVGFNPGCQDVSYEDLGYIRHIFDRIATNNSLEVEIVRKLNVWCVNCGLSVGYIKLPFIEVPFSRAVKDDVKNITMRSETLKCEKCYFHTTVAIEEEIYRVQ